MTKQVRCLMVCSEGLSFNFALGRDQRIVEAFETQAYRHPGSGLTGANPVLGPRGLRLQVQIRQAPPASRDVLDIRLLRHALDLRL